MCGGACGAFFTWCSNARWTQRATATSAASSRVVTAHTAARTGGASEVTQRTNPWMHALSAPAGSAASAAA